MTYTEVNKKSKDEIFEIIQDKMINLTKKWTFEENQEINHIVEYWNHNHYGNEQIHIQPINGTDYI